MRWSRIEGGNTAESRETDCRLFTEAIALLTGSIIGATPDSLKPAGTGGNAKADFAFAFAELVDDEDDDVADDVDVVVVDELLELLAPDAEPLLDDVLAEDVALEVAANTGRPLARMSAITSVAPATPRPIRIPMAAHLSVARWPDVTGPLRQTCDSSLPRAESLP